MALLELNLNPTGKTLRWFAGVWFPAFWGLAGLALFRRHDSFAAFLIWGVAAVLALAGLAAPRVIRPFYLAMMRATYPIGLVMSLVAMSLSYFVVFSVFGRLMRMFHDPMERRLDRAAASYWVPCEPCDQESYFRQL